MLGRAYPIEVSVSFHMGLLHWADSLAGLAGPGLTAGKTARAHQFEYNRIHGKPTSQAIELLHAFREVRLDFAARATAETRDALTLAFFESSDLDAALHRAAELLDDDEQRVLTAALHFFAPLYRPVWNDGELPRAFLERAASSDKREQLAKFLVEIARFFGVSPTQTPSPRMILVPVTPGHGTHAQAIGRFLLIELRPGEELGDEIPPIVHENAHFLFSRMDPVRLGEATGALAEGRRSEEALRHLNEALPTAIAQGVAGQKFLHRWSKKSAWYHTDTVDAYAKRIFPTIKRALSSGGTFDGELLQKLVAEY